MEGKTKEELHSLLDEAIPTPNPGAVDFKALRKLLKFSIDNIVDAAQSIQTSTPSTKTDWKTKVKQCTDEFGERSSDADGSSKI